MSGRVRDNEIKMLSPLMGDRANSAKPNKHFNLNAKLMLRCEITAKGKKSNYKEIS